MPEYNNDNSRLNNNEDDDDDSNRHNTIMIKIKIAKFEPLYGGNK